MEIGYTGVEIMFLLKVIGTNQEIGTLMYVETGNMPAAVTGGIEDIGNKSPLFFYLRIKKPLSTLARGFLVIIKKFSINE